MAIPATLAIPLPVSVAKTGGGQATEMTLREPQLRHMIAVEKLVRTDRSIPQTRLRDVELVSLVSGLDKDALRGLPVSIQARAFAFLDRFLKVQFPSADLKETELVIALDPPIKGPDGEEYGALHLSEPTLDAVERAEETLREGPNPYSIRLYQQALINRGGDLPATVVPMLPVSVANRATRFLDRFTEAGPGTGES